MKKLDKKQIWTIILSVLIFAALYWFNLPSINVLSTGFWSWLLMGSFFSWIVSKLLNGTLHVDSNSGMPHFSGGGEKKKRDGKKFRLVPYVFPFGILAIMIVFGILSADMFHAGSYSSRMIPATGETSDLPTSDDVNHISLMDTDSAQILGDRVIGSLSDVVSQFEVSSSYTTLVYNDSIIKIAPLEYGGFFKYFNNLGEIPGYVMVNTQSFDATFVRTDAGIRYSPSGYFLDRLSRHLRFQFPFSILGTSTFEIDESGHPYWVTGVYSHKFLFGGDYMKGAIITDPSTGESTYYEDPESVPDWVDNVYTGSFACDLYDSYGMLRNGWINSWIGQKGCLKTTNDFGYLAKGNDLYAYTGITSVAADQSNLGFIMVDLRTGKCEYVPCAGAEEYSAMSAAQGVVQDYGYSASFPSLVTVGGIPSYALVLKDTAGLVKEYAVVNVNNYTIVSVSNTFAGALKDYSRKVASDTSGGSTAADTGEKKVTVKVKSVIYADTDGNTFAYLVAEDDTVYKIAVSADETVVTISKGDTVEIEYASSSDGQAVIAADSVTKESTSSKETA